MLLFATSIHRARAAVFASAMVATALLAAGCTPGAAPTAQVPSAATSHPPSAETAKRADDLRALARDVYVWGYPIVDNYRIMHAYVIDRQHPEYKGPFNAVHSNARLITPQDRAVLSPNSDTPYSLAWLDLRAEPMVLSVPRVERGRYYSIQMIDLYTHNVGYIGSRTTGNGVGHYLIAGPDWQGEKPAGIDQVFRMETQLLFAVFRTQLFGPRDMPNVHRVQRGYKVEPLSAYLQQPPPIPAPDVEWLAPVSAEAQRTSLEFFNELAFALQFIPVHPLAKSFRERLAAEGFVPGRRLDFDKADPAIREALLAGMRDGQAAIEAERAKRSSSVGMFGSRADMNYDVVVRAAGAQAGIYANSPEEAFYATYDRDAAGAPLDGHKRYTLRFPKGGLPPVKGFWSATMYDSPDQMLVENPIDRYLINSTMLDTLKRDADGGITLYLQHASPGKDRESNWLPAPAGPFFVVLRNYWPDKAIIDGTWKAPPLQPVQ